MAKCECCGRQLINQNGKCLYCGATIGSASQQKLSGVQSGINKSKPIIQRRSYVNQGGQSPYSQYAGQSNIPGAKTDRYGNPQGSQYDLAKDGAFKGYKIVVLYLCDEGNMYYPTPALEKKGFTVISLGPGDVNKLQGELNSDKCQLWIVSHRSCYLTDESRSLIYDHFNRGRGLYIWSDNDPYFADSNILLDKLFQTNMSGDYSGEHILSIQKGEKQPGIIKDHPITTGLQNFYEGITISNVKLTQDLKPLVYSSDGLVVTAYYNLAGKRALIDGGFTRLYYKWDSAGTDRFVVNCAAWLANIERFGYHPE